MATIIDDTKVNSMLGAVSQATNQTTGAITQIEQWNSLAQNVNGILDKIMQLKNKSADAPASAQSQVQQITPMENKVVPNQPITTQPQTNTMPTIFIDNNKLKEKILQNFAKLKNLPADIQAKPISELIALGETNQAMLDSFIPMIANELKECVKWT